MASGTIKWFDPNKGHGLIRPDHGGDVFVHVSALQASRLQRLQEGQAVHCGRSRPGVQVRTW